MPSVAAMLNQVNMVSDVSRKFFRNDYNAIDKSILISGPIQTNADLIKDDYGSPQPALAQMVENYSEDRDSFRSELQDTMQSLRQSSDRMEETVRREPVETNSGPTATLSTLGEFANGNVPPEELTAELAEEAVREKGIAERTENAQKVVRENRAAQMNVPRPPVNRLEELVENYLVAEESGNATENPELSADERVAGVQNFVREYNATVSFLNENRGLSGRMSALANSFGGNENLTQSLEAVGISVNSSGQLSVNAEVLSEALERNSNGVTEALGSNGLAGQMNRGANLAEYQSENLFPNIADYSQNRPEENSEYLYAAQNARTATYANERTGNVLNMFT